MLLTELIQLLDQRLAARIVGRPAQLLAIGHVVEQRLRLGALQRLECPRAGARLQLDRQQRLERLAFVLQEAGPQRYRQAALDALDRRRGGAIPAGRPRPRAPGLRGAGGQQMRPVAPRGGISAPRPPPRGRPPPARPRAGVLRPAGPPPPPPSPPPR